MIESLSVDSSWVEYRALRESNVHLIAAVRFLDAQRQAGAGVAAAGRRVRGRQARGTRRLLCIARI